LRSRTVMVNSNVLDDVHATAEAVRILSDLRVRHSGEIPLPVWRLMARAEAKLNREIESYFDWAGDEPGRSADRAVDGLSAPGPHSIYNFERRVAPR